MPLRNSVGHLTKTDAEDQHIALCSADDSLPSTFNPHGHMLAFKHGSNKEAPLTCSLEDSFHATLSSLIKGGELSPQHWSHDLSPFHTSETICSESPQAFDNVNRLSAVDEFGFDSGFLFGDRKETVSQLPSTFRQRPAYKYDDVPATELSNHKLNDYAGLIRRQGSSSELMYSSQRPTCTMAYQESWPNRFPNYGVHTPDERLSMSSPAPQIMAQRDYITPVVGVRRASEQNVAAHIPSTQYGPNIGSQTQHSTMSTACGDSCARCIEHSASPPLAPSSTHSVPMHTLRSQSEGSILHSWSPQPIDTSAYQYSSPDHQSQATQAWWGSSSLPNRNLQSYAHNGYPPIVMAPVPQRPHPRLSQPPAPAHENSLAVHVDHQSELSPVPEPALAIPPLSCPEPTVGPTYPLELAHSPFQRPSPFDPSHDSAASPLVSPVSPCTSMPPIGPSRIIPTSATHRSPKSRLQNATHQRRINVRRTSSSPGISSSKASKATTTNLNSINSNTIPGNRNPVPVSFVNFTPEDSQKLLTGVAPSGSSKTKARREQEAREKRRKLSEAALLAVRKAGGDVEALEAVLC
ncbi:hypothetical protein PRK78_006360 [Emydomyces testavorans]|uniref:Developmental regulatory protein wetA n=1 Tax=Emydomyces testavorans TaxID=2070801 RepID=A0AAF0DLL7_9EURO|nr:hypothetical protein PRK78_006360 [Emydomyces testavorans]